MSVRVVRIVVVDYCADELDPALDDLGRHGLYDLRGACSAGEAKRLFREHRPHVALMELGPGPERFALIREFAARASVVVTCGSGTMQDGFTCRDLGVLRKPVRLVSRTVTDTIRTAFEEYRYRPPAARASGGFAADLCDALLRRAPRSVGHWAQHLDVCEAYLRKGCERVYGRTPREVLKEFKYNREAFRVADERFLGHGSTEVGFVVNDKRGRGANTGQ